MPATQTLAATNKSNPVLPTTPPSAAARELSIHIHKEMPIAAPARMVFDSILAQLGTDAPGPEGKPMHFRIEPWPGGRWFRDLGNAAGHLWAHVQVIKPPTLLELWGPMFMSYAAINHVQYRVAEQAGGKSSVLTLTHRAFGDIAPEHREGVQQGWEMMMKMIAERAVR